MLTKQSMRGGMRNEWSSRISAVLDITIEDDEGVTPYVCTGSAHIDCHGEDQ